MKLFSSPDWEVELDKDSRGEARKRPRREEAVEN